MATEQDVSFKIKELAIPIPYGFIAAKAWGSEEGTPVLALHGWQDNAGTFDTLIPHLSPSLYVVAIDAIGHGLSSHKPKGNCYHIMEILVDIKRVIDHLKWQKFSIIGHSLGGILGVLYSCVFPEVITNLILLDIIKPASRLPLQLPQITHNGVLNILHLEQKLDAPAPVYSYKDAKSRLITAMHGNITDESAEILLKRGSKASECGKGIIFTRDIRVRATEDLQKLSHDDLKAYMKKLRCNLLIILGKDSVVSRSSTPEVLDDFLDIYKSVCKTFQIVEIEGNHFVHLNHPERVAPHINTFLEFEFSGSPKL